MNEPCHLLWAKDSYKIFLKGEKSIIASTELILCFCSVEQAITKMMKGEHARLTLKSKATAGVEKFNIPSDTPVEYEVTLINFEKVRAL